MKRIEIRYDGADYSIGHRAVEDIQAEIAEGLATGRPRWLTVNRGEGRRQETFLLIYPGMSLAITPDRLDEEPSAPHLDDSGNVTDDE